MLFGLDAALTVYPVTTCLGLDVALTYLSVTSLHLGAYKSACSGMLSSIV